jgi:diguanylate cyclase (GGDEF)-like protein/PAS domain S-box-containing protein
VITNPHAHTLRQFEAALAAGEQATYELELFVNGASELSSRAIANTRSFCDTHLRGRYELSVVDLSVGARAELNGQVIGAPTLVKRRPIPVQTFVGDLTHTERVLAALQLPPTAAAPSGRPDAAAPPATLEDAVRRLDEAEDTLRAIGAGEIDAFVVSGGAAGQRLFTLSTADRPYRMFVANMRDGAATVSASGLVMYANQRLADLLGCSRASVVGSPLADHIVEAPPDVAALRGPRGRGATLELFLRNNTGGHVPVLVGSSLLDIDGDQLTCMTFTDLTARKAQDREIVRLSNAQAQRLTELRAAQAALTEQATHDALTGLPNRVLLVDRIEQALTRAKRTGRSTAVLFVDLDRFKQVNDSRGHAVGDDVLRVVADLMTAVMRPMDTVARIGGDEFVLLAPDLQTHLDAVAIAARLVTAMSRHAAVVEGSYSLAASIGVAVSVAGRGTAETLVSEADMAMYRAKSLGGGRAEVFDKVLKREYQQRAVAEDVLLSALNERRVTAHYQPVIEVASGLLAGFEALARIVQRDGSVLPPAAFISVAESTGLIVPLGGQVLELACAEASGWRSPGSPPLTVAVNVAAKQFVPGDLAKVVQEALERTGLPPSCLNLELTETAIIDLHPEILDQLAKVRDLGVEIGLDDFGTGYASLTHLRRLPLSFVKIDQTFVQGIEAGQEDDRIVAAVVDLAANLQLRSIAEGVETERQFERLRELGCDQAQGYLFARPLVAADATAFIGTPVVR